MKPLLKTFFRHIFKLVMNTACQKLLCLTFKYILSDVYSVIYTHVGFDETLPIRKAVGFIPE